MLKRMSKEKEEAIMKYMTLRIQGIGAELTDKDQKILNEIPEEEWKAIRGAIKDLGGKVESGSERNI